MKDRPVAGSANVDRTGNNLALTAYILTSHSTDRSVLLVGNFLSAHVGIHCVCEELAANLQSAGIHVITTSKYRSRIPRLLDMVWTIIRRRREYGAANVDVYSGLGFVLAEASCEALRISKKPYVLTLHGGNLPIFSQRWPRRVRRLLAGADAVTTPSRYLMQHLHQFRGDIQLLPNPVQLDRYSFRLRSSPQPRLIWIRSFHHMYNPMLAADVISLLIPEFPEIELVMVGPDKGDGSLQATQQRADQLGVADRIQFIGGVPKRDIPKYLEAADVFINTTNVDNTPISVLEAMACGLCVVSTNVGGIPHLLNDNEQGLLVPPRDPTAMAGAIAAILTDPGTANRLSAAAHQHSQQFDWESIRPRWVELFANISDRD